MTPCSPPSVGRSFPLMALLVVLASLGLPQVLWAQPSSSGIPNFFVAHDTPPTVINLEDHFDDPLDGAAGLSYRVESVSNERIFRSLNLDDVANTLTLNHRYLASGESRVYVRATNSVGESHLTQFLVRASQRTLFVETLTDKDDGGPNPSPLSLREAIRIASTGDLIRFEGVLGGGTLTLDDALGSLVVDRDLALRAPGGGLTIDGDGSSTILVTSPGAALRLEDFTLTNGVGSRGGGIFAQGPLSVVGSTFTGFDHLHTAPATDPLGELTAGVAVLVEPQGGVGPLGPGYEVHIEDSHFVDNSFARTLDIDGTVGGAFGLVTVRTMDLPPVHVTVRNTRFEENAFVFEGTGFSAGGLGVTLLGDAATSPGVTLDVVDSGFHDNTIGFGAAVNPGWTPRGFLVATHNFPADPDWPKVTVSGVSITNNEVDVLPVAPSLEDGGLLNSLQGQLVVRDTLIDNNTLANTSGGMVGGATTMVELDGLTVTNNIQTGLGNHGGVVVSQLGGSLANSVVRGNVADFGSGLARSFVRFDGNDSLGGSVLNTLFEDNTVVAGASSRGGMVSISNLDGLIADSVFRDNTISITNAAAETFAGYVIALSTNVLTNGGSYALRRVVVDNNVAETFLAATAHSAIHVSHALENPGNTVLLENVSLTRNEIDEQNPRPTAIGSALTVSSPGVSAANRITAQVRHSTIFNNVNSNGAALVTDGSNVTLNHTIAAANTDQNSPQDPDISTGTSSGGFNLIGRLDALSLALEFVLSGDTFGTFLTPINPQLLMVNGGRFSAPVPMPQATSGAVDTGNTFFAPPPTRDVRGSARVQPGSILTLPNPVIDKGAVEFGVFGFEVLDGVTPLANNDTVDLGVHSDNAPLVHTITVQNPTSSFTSLALDGESLQVEGLDFRLESGFSSVNLPPGGSATFEIAFLNRRPGPASASATFTALTAPTQQFTVNFTATGEPETLVVDSDLDNNDGDYSPGEFTFREAIILANADSRTNRILFDLPVHGAGNVNINANLPELATPVRIDGAGEGSCLPLVFLENPGSVGTGIDINTNDSLVRGLAVYHFTQNQFLVRGNQNILECNYIGVKQSLPDPDPIDPNTVGVQVTGADNEIGRPGAGNLIAHNGFGVRVQTGAATGNVIAGNRIGIGLDGETEISNLVGVSVSGGAANVTVGGAAPGAGNIISGNAGHGVELLTGGSHLVDGNTIGLNEAGDAVVANQGSGVHIASGSNNQIGLPGSGNIISGNDGWGVHLDSSNVGNDNLIQGNIIGLDGAGTTSVGNALGGVYLERGSNHAIGGTAAGAGNVISGNTGPGIRALGAGMNGLDIFGNIIGADASGSIAVGNDLGILIENANDVFIGGLTADHGNLISGNRSDGVHVDGGTINRVTIQGNIIGLTQTGDAPLGNGRHGVALVGTVTDAIVGGGVAGAENYISGNVGNGVFIGDAAGINNPVVQRNLIGPGVASGSLFPNGVHGIESLRVGARIGGLAAGLGNTIVGHENGAGIRASGNTLRIEGNTISGNETGLLYIGGTGSIFEANTIDQNLGAGIIATGTGVQGVQILENTITSNGLLLNRAGLEVLDNAQDVTARRNIFQYNGRLGIDLAGDGVTPNDPLDADTGPNDLRNFPLMDDIAPGANEVTGRIEGLPSTTIRVDLYQSANAHPSLHGEAANWVGTASVLTNPDGEAVFAIPLPPAQFPAGAVAGTFFISTAGLTAATGGVSEFSRVMEVKDALDATIDQLDPPLNNFNVVRYGIEFNSPALPIDPSEFDVLMGGDLTGAFVDEVRSDFANALLLDGATSITLQQDPALEFSGDYTVEALVRVDTPGVNPVLSNRDGTDGWMLAVVDGLPVLRDAAGNEVAPAVPSIPIGQWVHVAVVVSPGNDHRVYLDGIEVADLSIALGSTTSTTGYHIGYDAMEDAYFEGALDELRLWDRVLTTAEISSGSTRVVDADPDLAARWAFDENLEEAINDLPVDAVGGAVAFTQSEYRSSMFTVFVNTGTGDGTVSVTLPVGADVSGVYLEPLTGLPLVGAPYTIDKTPPVISIAPLFTDLSSPQVTGTLTDEHPPATVSVVVNGEDVITSLVGDDWEVAAGTLTPLPPGIYDITVTGTDLAGNTTVESILGGLWVQQPIGIPVDVTDDVDNGNYAPGDLALREAMTLAASAPATSNTIFFAIPGPGPHVIQLLEPLPIIDTPMTIDGRESGICLPTVAIDGQGVEDFGFVVEYPGAGILGLAVYNTLEAAIAVLAADVDVRCNHLGIELDGLVAGASNQGAGVWISASGGLVADNVIGGLDVGVDLASGSHSGNSILSNTIGLGVDGSTILSNTNVGIRVGGDQSDVTIGGFAAGEGNVVAGSSATLIDVGTDASLVSILGNTIGLTSDGMAAAGSSPVGIRLLATSDVTIESNLIGGLSNSGILVASNSTMTTIQSNRVGVNDPETGSIPNGTGIVVTDGATLTTIQGNTISGNQVAGIEVSHGADSTDSVTILNNRIGTNSLGNTGIPNLGDGINNQVGNTVIGPGNLIANNTGRGIFSSGAGSIMGNNTIRGNAIGIELAAVAPASVSGNLVEDSLREGILVVGSSNFTITDNTIRNNGLDGVYPAVAVDHSSSRVRIVENSISDNSGLGIDLGRDGVTLNDFLDLDTGANDLQNFPVLNIPSISDLGISGSLSSSVETTFTIHLYRNTVCHPSGYGEGAEFIGSTDVFTNTDGVAFFSIATPDPLVASEIYTATATTLLGSTSEFSRCVTVVGPPVVVDITLPDPNPTNAPAVDFIVEFDRPVVGVDTSSMELLETGITGSAITSIDDHVGPAGLFTGNQGFQATRPTGMEGDSTIEFWMRLDPADLAGMTAGATRSLLVYQGTTTGTLVLLGHDDVGRIVLTLDDGVTSTTTATLPAATNNWHHVAVTRDQTTGAMDLYLDHLHAGTVVGTTDPFDSTLPLLLPPDSSDVVVALDHFRVWGSRFDQQEVKRAGGNPFLELPTGPLLHYTFGDIQTIGNFQVIGDASGNDNNAFQSILLYDALGTTPSGASSNTYRVTVATGFDNGELALVVPSPGTITSASGTPISNVPFTSDPYTIKKFIPPPTVPVMDPADDSGFFDDDLITNVQQPTFTGFGEGGAIIRLISDLDGVVGLDNTPGDYTDPVEPWSITTSVLTEGTHIIHATAEDFLGNLSDPSTSITVVIDITPPAQPPPPILPPEFDSGDFDDDQITNITNPTLVGTAEPNSFVQLISGFSILGSDWADATGAYAIPVSFPIDNTYAVLARAIDLAGNVGPFSDPLLITIDTTPPPPPVITLDPASDSGRFDTDHITNITTPTLVGTAEANSLVRIFANGDPIAVVRTNPDATWSTTTIELAEGVYTITATATDIAGNTGNPGVLVPDLVIDLTPPDPPSIPDLLAEDDSGRFDDDNITNVVRPRFQGTTEPDALVTLSADGVDLGSAIADGDGNYLIQVDFDLADGVYEVVARAEDLAGNEGENSDPLILVIDTIPPPPPSTPNLLAEDDSGRSDSDNVTNVNTPRFDGTSEEFAYVELIDILAPGQPVLGINAPDDAGPEGEWVTQVFPALPDGNYLIAARAIDIAGNVGDLSDFLLVTIDTTPPDPPIIIGLAEPPPPIPGCGDDLTSSSTPLITGTAEDAAFVRFFDALSGIQVGFGVSVGGTFVIGTMALPDGVHEIVADATDVAGNVSGLSAPYIFVIDTQPPRFVLVDVNNPDTGTPEWSVAQDIPVRVIGVDSPIGLGSDPELRLYVRHEYYDPVVSNPWTYVGDIVDGEFLYSPPFGKGRYYFHVEGTNCVGTTTGIPVGTTGSGVAKVVYNTEPNSRLVLDVPAGTVEVFPMTNTARAYIDYTFANPQGYVAVYRHDDIPFGFESTVFIKESLNIQGAFDGSASLTWHYDPDSPSDLNHSLSRVYRFEGGTRTIYPGAPGSSAIFNEAENWLRVSGIDSFSWWYAGSHPTHVDDWLMY